MKLIPTAVSRTAHRSLLKLNVHSPTILVVTGVVGFGVTAVMAAKASRSAEPVLDGHAKGRIEISEHAVTQEQERKQVAALYTNTTVQLARVYGPTIVVGTMSAASILHGHRILQRRHVASLLAYSGLFDQFTAYRNRVAQTLGNEAEKDIYDGAHGEYVEDPDHKGEYKLAPKFASDETSYLRPWLDERNGNCHQDPGYTKMWLTGIQNFMNVRLNTQGHLYLNEVLRALGMPEAPEGQVAGWLKGGDGDQFVDFGFMVSNDPHTIAFNEGQERTVRLNFNIDGNVFEKMLDDKYRV